MNTPDLPSFRMIVSSDGWTQVVHVTGELDLDTRDAFDRACFAGNEFDVVVDMSELTFMDCAGYSGLVGTLVALEAIGGTLTIRAAVGQPRHLLDLLAHSEQHSTAKAA